MTAPLRACVRPGSAPAVASARRRPLVTPVPPSPLGRQARRSAPGGVRAPRHGAPRPAAFRPLAPVGFLLDTPLRRILLSTTRRLAGRHHTAGLLAPPGSVPPIAGIARGGAPALLARLASGGSGAILARPPWVTPPNCMGSLPMPRFWASLGTTSAGFGASVGRETHFTRGPTTLVPPRLLSPVCRWLRSRAVDTRLARSYDRW